MQLKRKEGTPVASCDCPGDEKTQNSDRISGFGVQKEWAIGIAENQSTRRRYNDGALKSPSHRKP